jgi:deoxyribose-phosphate aldolase
VKASGGVKNIDDARAMVQAGATRIGASVGVKIAQEAAGVKSNGHAPAGY